jgi:segregation and condensation protein B
MQPDELTPLVEALLFVSDQPLTVPALTKAVGDQGVTSDEVRKVLELLGEGYDAQPRGFKLVKLGSGYQVVTRERYAPWVKSLLAGKQKARLSRAALETAAVIAYKQPITRIGIERIRGVDAGGVLNTLLERALIMIKGRDPGPGRPLLYGTTQTFLDYFGLSKLGDLPRMDEIAALARAEGRDEWTQDERIRLERHGVSPDDNPLAVEGPEPPATEPGEEAGEDVAEDREADRLMFQEVAADFAEEADASAGDEPDASDDESSESDSASSPMS